MGYVLRLDELKPLVEDLSVLGLPVVVGASDGEVAFRFYLPNVTEDLQSARHNPAAGFRPPPRGGGSALRALAGRPPHQRGGRMGGATLLKERAGVGEPGFRVFRVHVPSATREALVRLYRDVTAGRGRSKMLHYYLDEWESAFKEVQRSREQAGKRTPPRPPPLFFLVCFIVPDEGERGNTAAPCVIDLRKGELRISSYSIKIPLRPSLIRALIEENGLEPRPDFVLQLTSRGKLRLIARRAPPLPPLEAPLRIVAVDENSQYGFTIAVFDFSDCGCRLTLFEKLRPPNHGHRRCLTALLQGFADEPTEEKRAQLRQLLRQELVNGLTPERARKLAARARRKERRLNSGFVQRFAARAEARQGGCEGGSHRRSTSGSH